MFSETEGFIYGVDSEKNVVEVLDLSDQTRTQRESGLHTFDFMNLNSKDYLVVTYTGVDNKYHLSAFEVLPDLELGNEESLAIISDGNVETTKIHWGGKILQKDQDIILKAGDTVRVSTPGGGGFGNPLERDPHLVDRDVKRGYYSKDEAKEKFGYR